MLKDHVVTLQPEFALGVAAGDPAAPKVFVSLFAEAPSGRFRLRLWDAHGRDPKDPAHDPGEPDALKFNGAMRKRIGLAAENGFKGRTLTWTVRLQPTAGGQYYKVRVAILQIDGGKEVPCGEFAYSGPLDDFEEIGGRFHFDVTR